MERIEELGSSLGATHAFTRRHIRGSHLLQRLARNRRILLASYRSTVGAVQERRWISSAADWLINNFHVIQEQLRECREDLPITYYRGLPKLVGGSFSGLPRVYAMAAEFIKHTDARLEIETLRRFVAAYQAVAPLGMGEVWALPIMLRLAFIENLARIAVKVERARTERDTAAELASDLIRSAVKGPEEVREILNHRVAGRIKPSTTMFVTELLLRLRDQDPALELALQWLESRIVEQGTTVNEAIRIEHQSQAQNQASVGNAITSMRLITSTDWTKFFESMSMVEVVLREDPSGHYARMEFATRDRYRHVIEQIAKRTGGDEVTVARGAIQLARDGASAEDPRRAHVGYYLIDEGLPRFEAATGYRYTARELLSRFAHRHAAFPYLGGIALVTAALLVSLLFYLTRVAATRVHLGVALALAFIPASEFAVSLVNLLATALTSPRPLPKLDFREGIPVDCRTFVVVPMMLTNEIELAEALEALEVRYLANQDPHLHFGLLTDFADSHHEEEPNDNRLLELATGGIKRLNAAFGTGGDVFYLFHRPRRWNPSEQKFIGWERKRGKLTEFNRLLLGGDKSRFSLIVGDLGVVADIRYVITLDSDTRLPREVAGRLIGTIAHPLNAPRVDERKNMVITGHGIVQPRVSASLESSGRSAFSRLFSGQVGIDPYTTAVSDVYQDLFDAGSFVGKALYDVRVFEKVLEGRVPENTLLSHDLFEGSFARAGLASDIELFDDTPSRYLSHAARRHRWTRGDWQIAPWLFRWVPDVHGRARNVLSIVTQWKIADNLRRSLVAPTLLALLFAGWFVLPGAPLFWTLAVVVLVAFPAYAHLTTSMLTAPTDVTWASYLGNLRGETARNAAQSSLSLMFLPHQAWVSVDAIVRVFVRRFITHRKLLEWVHAARAERRGSLSIVSHYLQMWPSLAATLGVASWIVCHPGTPHPLAIGFAVTWLVAPYVAVLLSRPTPVKVSHLSPADQTLLRLTARKTWRYFETFLREEDNYLPPDNFQENPAPLVARRTSPTNMGLSLLATFVASDRGYTTLTTCVDGIERTIGAMERLDRYRGHFLNWYDTGSLKALLPRYISTVDSGNLAGHLLTVKQGLVQAFFRPLFGAHFLAGIDDTLKLLQEEARRLIAVRHWTGDRLVKQLETETLTLAALLGQKAPRLFEWVARSAALSAQSETIRQLVEEMGVERHGEDLDDLTYWATALYQQTSLCDAEFQRLAPWLAALCTAQEDAELARHASDIVAGLVDEAAPSAFSLLRQARDIEAWVLARLGTTEQIGTRARSWLASLSRAAADAEVALSALKERLTSLAERADALVEDMDFSFLYDHDRQVFSIGYNVGEARLDASFYDLLASESRLASFVAIAKGDVPHSHWYKLGRPFAKLDNGRALLSWTGTMFEYLMPCLVMRTYDGTLLDRTCRAVIRRQIEYGDENRVPWGTSEAAYNARDLRLNYQYAPFGVPGLGIKRGLGEDLVVAPYATALALLFAADVAVFNLRRLAASGLSGRYGFYESIDYTPSRVPEGESGAVVRAFMAHHQGMTLVAIAEYLGGGPMRDRFHSERAVQATQLLLQERMPHHVALAELNQQETEEIRSVADTVPHRYNLALDLAKAPEVQLLSNGSYSVMVTNAGGSSSRCRGLMVTRWREDATRDNWGQFCYLRDMATDHVWSTAYQPTLVKVREYEVNFALDKAEIRRVEAGIVSLVSISVSAEDNAEIRAVRLTNLSSMTREIELTTYSEIVLSPWNTDAGHPSFGNLFVETEFLAETGALLATRRPRSPKETPVWAVHVSATDGTEAQPLQYETDRAKFLGRGRTPAFPAAVIDDRPLSNTVGAVLDPIFSLRRRVRIRPGESVEVSFVTAIGDSREQAAMLAEKYRQVGAAARAAELTWTQAQAELHYLNIAADETRAFLKLASRLVFAGLDLRASPETLVRNTRCQSNLWGYGISGDLPILAVRVSEEPHIELVLKLLHAHEFWRLRGFSVDFVVINDHSSTYLQSFQDQLLSVVRSSNERDVLDRPGGVFVLRSDLMPPEDRVLVLTVARVVLAGERGSILEQIEQQPVAEPLPRAHKPRRIATTPLSVQSAPPRNVEFFNGLGGFSEDGTEYHVALSAEQWTPAPWSNVMANPRFGTLVTESGGGYTWADNSRENRLTPWSNDPVSDPVSEVIYLRDEETGACFNPTPLPIRGPESYSVRHGQGYSTYETSSHDIAQFLVVFVPPEDPVKISQLTLRNRGSARRRLTLTYYVDWTLGVLREGSSPYVVTAFGATSVLTAHNAYNNEFKDAVAFIGTSAKVLSFTGDRTEFIGRGSHMGRPLALERETLSGRVGAGLDPCGALQVEVNLGPGEESQVVFILGQGKDAHEVDLLAARYRTVAAASLALEETRNRWDKTLSTISVKTPDTSFDLMVNRWLLYQTLSCRVWGRTGFYQSGGAYGFRDQLQDVAALVYSEPQIARAQLLRAAARQFVEGDVQHWWHPPTGRGVRTKFSDDLLWLPYVLVHYRETTHDLTVLDEVIPFIEARLLEPHEEDAYLVPAISEQVGTLYEHCVRAIERSLRIGAHGLPLIGGGDWNDGMNRVGQDGRGESVWLGWFLHATLSRFAPLCEQRGDTARARRYRDHAEGIRAALEEGAWDGAWYLRAFFDDGSPLGSSASDECRIDSIAQTWSVISQAATAERQTRAIASVEEHLIREADELVLLFTPPFDRTALDPGYIKGYLPGVRENGGQYTHAAVWVVLAYAMLGDGDRAVDLFGLLNPINHTATRAAVQRYKVEPYVVAADVYAEAPHVGRGGWTWYTGSASWMYRVALESILGFQLRGDSLFLSPCIPSTWRSCSMTYRRGPTTYGIHFDNPDGVSSGIRSIELDGNQLPTTSIPLVDDGSRHEVKVILGRAQAAASGA